VSFTVECVVRIVGVSTFKDVAKYSVRLVLTFT